MSGASNHFFFSAKRMVFMGFYRDFHGFRWIVMGQSLGYHGNIPSGVIKSGNGKCHINEGFNVKTTETIWDDFSLPPLIIGG